MPRYTTVKVKAWFISITKNLPVFRINRAYEQHVPCGIWKIFGTSLPIDGMIM